MTRTSPLALPFAAVGVLAVALAGCASSVPESSTNAPSDATVNTVIGADPSGFSPFASRITVDTMVQGLLFDTLLKLDDDNTLVPALATAWTSDSATSYSLSIRDDATCADGAPITAETVAASLAVLADPETQSSARALIFGSGDATITAVDESTVSIELSEPFSELPTGLTFPQSGIVCTPGIDDPDGLLAGAVEGAFSGPYTLVDAQPGVNYEFALRDDYDQWPQYETSLEGAPAATINIGVSTDSATIANQLQSGDLDFASIGDDNVARFDNNADYRVDQVVTGWSYIAFNQRPGSAFADNIELRSAVAQAISREAYSSAVSNGRAPLMTSLADEQTQCVVDDESLLIEPDADAAAELLDGVQLSMVGATVLGAGGSGNVYIQEALNAAGAEVTLKNTDTAEWAAIITQQTEEWDITALGAQAPLLTSLTRVVGTPAEEGGRSVTGVTDPVADAAIAEALAAEDQAGKCAGYEAAQVSILENVDIVPLAAAVSGLVQRAGVSVQVPNGQLELVTLRVTS